MRQLVPYGQWYPTKFEPAPEEVENPAKYWRTITQGHDGLTVTLTPAELLRFILAYEGLENCLQEIRKQLDLHLPSEQTGPEWENGVRVPLDRLESIDALLNQVLGPPVITNEPMPERSHHAEWEAAQ